MRQRAAKLVYMYQGVAVDAVHERRAVGAYHVVLMGVLVVEGLRRGEVEAAYRPVDALRDALRVALVAVVARRGRAQPLYDAARVERARAVLHQHGLAEGAVPDAAVHGRDVEARRHRAVRERELRVAQGPGAVGLEGQEPVVMAYERRHGRVRVAYVRDVELREVVRPRQAVVVYAGVEAAAAPVAVEEYARVLLAVIELRAAHGAHLGGGIGAHRPADLEAVRALGRGGA